MLLVLYRKKLDKLPIVASLSNRYNFLRRRKGINQREYRYICAIM